MKKLLFLLIVICLLLASCDEILPSGEPEEEQHVHTWNAGYYTVVPTCQTDGERVYTCTTCNETKTEVVKYDEVAGLIDEDEGCDMHTEGRAPFHMCSLQCHKDNRDRCPGTYLG